jgi:excisionase family DNA binding protein
MRVRFVRVLYPASSDEPTGPVHAGPYQPAILPLTPPPEPIAAIPSSPPAPPFLSFREAAEWLCVSLSTLKRMVTKGNFDTVQVGKRRKIPANYLAAYVGRDLLIPKEDSEPENSIS